MAYVGEATHQHHLAIVKSRTRTCASFVLVAKDNIGVNLIADKLCIVILAKLGDGVDRSLGEGLPGWIRWTVDKHNARVATLGNSFVKS